MGGRQASKCPCQGRGRATWVQGASSRRLQPCQNEAPQPPSFFSSGLIHMRANKGCGLIFILIWVQMLVTPPQCEGTSLCICLNVDISSLSTVRGNKSIHLSQCRHLITQHLNTTTNLPHARTDQTPRHRPYAQNVLKMQPENM